MSDKSIEQLPDILRERVNTTIDRFSAKNVEFDMAEEILDVLPQLWAKSNFIAQSCLKYVQVFHDLITSGQLNSSLSAIDYRKKLEALCALTDEETFCRQLRLLRCKEMLRIAWRDLERTSEVEQTLQELSSLADACILATLDFSFHSIAKRFGMPVDQYGNKQCLYVLAMGKLGGQELNFSSDIDLIFCYPDEGETEGGKQTISNASFYTRVVQLFTKIMTQVMAEGIVFRVDLRLRPNGDSGALVSSFTTIETYYQEQGRGWERYAMVKARVINDEDEYTAQLRDILLPFVYRRYVDFSVIEALRSLKSLIEREVKIKGFEQDIKRGPGGIREIEFICQALQLIHGGKLKALQQQSLISTIAALKTHQLIPDKQADTLAVNYLFLRRLENCLQMLDDRQTHLLPNDELECAQVAHAMGYSMWSELKRDVNLKRRQVSRHFSDMLSPVVGCSHNDEKILDNQLLGVWQNIVDQEVSQALLSSLGFSDPSSCYQMLNDFRHGRKCRTLSQIARLRLDRFMPLLLRHLSMIDNGRDMLLRVFRLLDAIVLRSAYLALLTENIQALQHLLRLFSLSAWIAEQVSNHPYLLEVLLDPDALYKPLQKAELSLQLSRDLEGGIELEQQLDVLRHFKLKQTLKVAAADVTSVLSMEQVSQHLTVTATVILERVFAIACAEITDKHPDAAAVGEHVVIVAYGKLGGYELNYASDLDLVFLHNNPPELEKYTTRLVKRVVHLLSIRSAAGILYPVDTRLRPSGLAGLLVSHIDAYYDYQTESAWTWEHQALVRARVVAGDTRLRVIFNRMRSDILCSERSHSQLRQDIVAMRRRMREEVRSGDNPLFELKHGAGGLIDIEFLVQYTVLAYAHRFPTVVSETDNLGLLQLFDQLEVLDKHSIAKLAQAYRQLRQVMHGGTILSHKRQQENVEGLDKYRQAVVSVWQRWMLDA